MGQRRTKMRSLEDLNCIAILVVRYIVVGFTIVKRWLNPPMLFRDPSIAWSIFCCFFCRLVSILGLIENMAITTTVAIIE